MQQVLSHWNWSTYVLHIKHHTIGTDLLCVVSYCPRKYIVEGTVQPVYKNLLSLHYLLPAEHMENKIKTKNYHFSLLWSFIKNRILFQNRKVEGS